MERWMWAICKYLSEDVERNFFLKEQKVNEHCWIAEASESSRSYE